MIQQAAPDTAQTLERDWGAKHPPFHELKVLHFNWTSTPVRLLILVAAALLWSQASSCSSLQPMVRSLRHADKCGYAHEL